MELANTMKTEISRVEQLAVEAQMLRTTINLNMLQLGRIFTEAKPLVPHGEWEKWVKNNADCSVRLAQDMMAAWKRFGNNPRMQEIEKSKMFKLLPLPEEQEEKFLAEHDVENMSAREIQEAVRKAKSEAQAEIDRIRQETLAEVEQAKQSAKEVIEDAKKAAAEEAFHTGAEQAAEQYRGTVDELKAEIQKQRDQLEYMKATAQAAMEGTESWRTERAELERRASELEQESREYEDMLKDLQEELERSQTELLNVKSEQARGDAERAPVDRLTLDVFAGAVRQFIGACARMPQMHLTFSGMAEDERRDWEELLGTVEQWAAGSRKALDTMSAEGGYVL